MESTQSSEERGAERQMDDYLKSIGFQRKKVAKDGSCLFRAVAEQVLHCQSLHTNVRAKCVEFLKQNRENYEAFIEGDFEDYLFKLQDPQQWVGEVEINALAVIYKRDFQIFQEPGRPAVDITKNNFKDKVRLCFLNGNHYDSVYPISHIKSSAICQSIVFEMLYDDVFKVDRSLLSVCQRGARGRGNEPLIDDNMVTCASSDESDVDTGEPLWAENGTNTTAPRHSNRGRGRGRLPERVWRSLNPTLLRNIEYDVWHKSKRAQQKLDYSIAAGMQFSAGDRCQVRLEPSGRSYNATVKEVPSDNGLVTVYLEEQGRRQVPLWSLRPPCDENSWSTVVNRDKKLSNGLGDWEDRGRGRGRGKHPPAASSSATTAAAAPPGSTGRMLKQHSWPPQANAEEQGGAKPTRKSVSSVDAAFGITEEHRLAKEEEERNVALVEIQLRDEHSFPALGVRGAPSVGQGDGGRKKGGEKKRPQRNKMSPVDDVRTPSPPAGETPKSPDLTTPAPPTKPPAAPSADSDSTASLLSSNKASLPKTNMAAVSSSSSAAVSDLTDKPNLPSYASAAGAPPTSPITSLLTGGSVPSSASLFSFITPVLPPASSPSTSHAISSSSPPPPPSSSSKPLSSSPSPPPPSSVPTPTFIAPIAPSPAAAQQSFLHSSSLPRSSPPPPSLPHSPSPPTVSSLSLTGTQSPQNQTPLSQVDPVVSVPQNQSQIFESQTQSPISFTQKLYEDPPLLAQTQTPLSQNQTMSSLPQTQTPLIENQTLPSLPQNQSPMPQTEIQTGPPELQPQPQSNTDVTQVTPTIPQAHYPPHSQPEVVQSHSSYPLPSQPSVPVTHPPPHVQPPHPSQIPHPTLSMSPSQTQIEASQPPPESPPHPSPLQSHLPPPSLHPHPESLSAHPPPLSQPSSLPVALPMQQLAQLYQDPLYPGFPQAENGQVVPTPSMSSSRLGDDLPQDIHVLRFFFNLGIKAYSMHLFPPYVYLLPLQQAHTMHPKIPSRSPSPSPSPHYPPSNPPPRPQEAYPHPPYPPTSSTMHPQFDHQVPPPEHPRPSDPSHNQAGYPVTHPPPHRMPPSWQQQMPPPRNQSFPVGYPSPNQAYAVPPPISQGYHPGHSPGHPLYPPTGPSYPPSSLGYQSTSEELQGAMEQHQPTNGDTMHGQRPVRATSLLGSPPTVNLANPNISGVVPGFGHMKEHAESLTRAVLMGELPVNNNHMLVSNPGDLPVLPTAMKPNSAPYEILSTTPAPPHNNPSYGYRGYTKPPIPTNTYVPLGAPEPPGHVDYLPAFAMAGNMSVGCNTEDDWDEQTAHKQTNYRGPRRYQRGGRGRGGYDPGRGANRRRHGGGDSGTGYNNMQFYPTMRGRGREREY
ncbi:OTU domain-containing protein 4 isoform X2 [Notolabrus celidotus]|uniref:OTU domain-containing protein 4 isoform X2 n=1 Tax=Notolabrus celidotus TaxID=1203425 RepID=UPI00148FD790|nr:OTU domain-containing protein 4 isoform X2 [Notolabrus celidotus]